MAISPEGAARSPKETFPIDAARRRRMIVAVANSVIEHVAELTALDAAIGDGDHGHNMKRGCEAVLQDLDALSAMSLPDLLKAVGTKLVMKVGGASGPLYGTLFMALGKELPADPSRAEAANAFAAAIAARPRARQERGGPEDDARCPYSRLPDVRLGRRLRRREECGRRRRAGDGAGPRDARSRFVSRRSIDRPCRPRRAIVVSDDRRAVRRVRRAVMANVGIVIVSHSPKVAEGAADMVRQMVGAEVPLAWTGGNPDGGLGTSCEAITEAIHRAWSEAGVAVLVDLGGAETNSEMAIEMLPEDKRNRVVVCNAPIVEGAVIAATEASGGASLAVVRRTAEELSP